MPTTTNIRRFSGNFDEYTIASSEDQVSVEISLRNQSEAAGSSFVEVFHPIDGAFTLTDLRDMTRAHFDFRTDDALLALIGARGIHHVENWLEMQLDVYEDGVLAASHVAKIFNSELEMPVDDWYNYSMFLSRSNEQLLADGCIGVANWLSNRTGQQVKIGVAYLNEEQQLKYEQFTLVQQTFGTTSPTRTTFTFTWEDILQLLNEEEVDIDDVELLYIDLKMFENNVLKDQIKFHRTKTLRKNEVAIAFVGAMGEVELMYFTGQRKRDADLNGTFLQAYHNFEKSHSRTVPSFTAYTGHIREWQRELVYDLADSRTVYLLEDGRLIPITITDIDFSETEPHTSPIGLTITYQRSDITRQRTFKRTANIPNQGVFDETFDESFE